MSHLIAAIRRTAVFVDRWDWVWLTLAAPLLLFPSQTRMLALLIVPAVWLIALIAGRPLVTRTPLNLSLLVMFAMVLVSEWATYDLAVSLPKIAGLVLGFGAFFSFARLGRERIWWLRIYAGVMALGVAIAGIGLLGTQWLYKIAFLSPILNRLPLVLRGLPGAEGGFQPNQVAGTLLWVLPIMLVGVIQARRNWRHSVIPSLGGLALLFVLGVFFLTQSRSGYIGLAAGLALMLSIWVPSRWRIWLVLGVFAGLIGVWAIVWGGSVEPAVQNGSAALSLDTLEGRVELWSRAIYGIEDFPLTGMGLNTFRHIVHVFYPLFLIGPDYDLGHAHNEFLQAALDLGLPGLIALIALYLGAFAMLGHIWRMQSNLPASHSPDDQQQGRHPDRAAERRTFALGLGGALLAHLVYGLTDAVALGAKPGLVFWIVLGLIAGLFEQNCSHQKRNSSPPAPLLSTTLVDWRGVRGEARHE